jgi:hypothetical protein
MLTMPFAKQWAWRLHYNSTSVSLPVYSVWKNGSGSSSFSRFTAVYGKQ